MNQYLICLADYEPILPELSRLIGAEYQEGSFLSFAEQFDDGSKDSEEWFLVGPRGQLSIKLEKFEGYYFSTFQAQQPAFEEGKKLLWESYLAQGGTPNARERR